MVVVTLSIRVVVLGEAGALVRDGEAAVGARVQRDPVAGPFRSANKDARQADEAFIANLDLVSPLFMIAVRGRSAAITAGTPAIALPWCGTR
jgi:hypothetical protein